MADKGTFGTILREAREHKRIGIEEVSRRLRIRPDIIIAIEESDFRRMPPQGYARNMINAYARYLGLNPTEVTTLFLEDARRHQNGTLGQDDDPRVQRSGRQERRGGSSSRDAGGRQDGRERRRSSDDQPSRGSRSRRQNNEGDARSPRSNRDVHQGSSRRRRNQGEDYSLTPPRGRQRGSEYSREDRRQIERLNNPRANSHIFAETLPQKIMKRLPLILIAAAVIALLVFVITSAVSCATADKTKDFTEIPVTGITDTTNKSTNNANTGNTNSNSNSNSNGTGNTNTQATEQAPTHATLQYTVASNSCALIELYEDGSTTPSVDEVVYGPETGTKQVTTTLMLVTTSPEYVKVTVDGSEVELKEDSDGVYSYTVNFEEILASWNESHASALSNKTSNTSR